ncbi:MAG: BamA/TamA family outer membrane protein [Cyclobacteriaceae bacterium]|nr:BamA/TamA family outer membrane protein [Cyclobacteriaceae bacterium]
MRSPGYMFIRILCFLLFNYFLLNNLRAQDERVLCVHVKMHDKTDIKCFQIADSLAVINHIQNMVNEWAAEGYLQVIKDVKFQSNDSVLAEIIPGERFFFKQIQLLPTEANLTWLEPARLSRLDGKPFRQEDLSESIDNILQKAANHGYPFLSARLDSIRFIENTVEAWLKLDPGPLMIFDTLEIHGYTKIKRSYLARHSKIKPGSLYREQWIDELPQRIGQLPFVTLKEKPEVYVYDNLARVEVQLEERKINRADGLIGFLPGQGPGGSLLITGLIDLSLHNLFQSGKQFDFQWQRTEVASQILHLSYIHPFLLGSNIDISGSFNLLKQDSSFLNTDANLAMSFQAGLRHRWQLSLQVNDSRTLTVDQVIRNTINEQAANFNIRYYGIGYAYNGLDDVFQPQKGIRTSIHLSAGDKSFRLGIDSLQGKALQLQSKAAFAGYLPLGKYTQFASESSMGWLMGNRIFINDLFRLGGYNTLRGFNENFFFTGAYLINRAEFRYTGNAGTQIFLLYDQGIMFTGLSRSKLDYPTGLGAGLRLPVKAGLFTLAYAFGSSNEQRLGMDSGRLHFGFTGIF